MDLTCNKLDDAEELASFVNLKTLIVDDNRFQTLDSFPVFNHLETFSANKNDFYDLQEFIEGSATKFRNLKNLSLLKNPLNPFF